MLRRACKKIIRLLMLGILSAAAIWAAYLSASLSLQLPTEAHINEFTNVGETLSFAERRSVIRSRSSTVQVMSLDVMDGGISISSGTYIYYQDHHLILTTSHGVGPMCDFTQIVVGKDLYDCKAYVLRDMETDYLIMEIAPLPDREPVRLPLQSPRHGEWKRDLAIQNTIFYTGFPNQGGPYTFTGRIVGYNQAQAIFVDSYGWSGSSGGGVFSASGNLIGWVRALEVGETYFGREVLENFIWVVPLFNVDWPAVGAFVD